MIGALSDVRLASDSLQRTGDAGGLPARLYGGGVVLAIDGPGSCR